MVSSMRNLNETFKALDTNTLVFSLLSITWFLLVKSAIAQKELSWFFFLFYARLIVFIISVVLTVLSVLKKDLFKGNLLAHYLAACMVLQSIFSCLEPLKVLIIIITFHFFYFLSQCPIKGVSRGG